MPFSLHKATKNNDIELLTRLLDEIKEGKRSKGQLEYHDADDCTPMHHVAHNGNIEILQLLLDAGAEIDSTTSMAGFTPLHLAIHNPKTPLEVAQCFVTNQVSLDTIDYAGKNYLHHAFYANRPDLVEYFMTLGVSAITPDNDGYAPYERSLDDCLEEVISRLHTRRDSRSSLRELVSNRLLQEPNHCGFILERLENHSAREELIKIHEKEACLSEDGYKIIKQCEWEGHILKQTFSTTLVVDELVYKQQNSHSRKVLETHFKNLIPATFPKQYAQEQEVNAGR